MDQQLTGSTENIRSHNLFDSDSIRAMREEFDSLIQRMARDWDPQFPSSMKTGISSMNLSESDDQLEITMDVPGVSADEIDLELSGQTLRVSGQHQEDDEEKKKRYHRVERRFGSFDRTILLPCNVEHEKISAECKNGVLTIKLPKSIKTVTSKVKVKG